MIEKAPKTEVNKDFIFINDIARRLENALLNNNFNKIDNQYLYWDKIKYLKFEKITPTRAWEIIKKRRQLNSIFAHINNIEYNFNINSALNQKLQYLDFNFGAGIQKEKLLTDLDKEYYLSNALMEESIFSSMIEGATTTRVKAKEMLRKKKSPKNKSEQMILNNYQAIQFISKNKEEDLSIEKLFEIHQLVTEKTLDAHDIGVFRTTDDVLVMNQITGEIVHTPPNHKELDELMQSFCDFFNTNPKENFIHPIVKASILHFLIGYIHPFVDGNGRTARALFYWYLLKNGYWLSEYLSISRVIMKTKAQYEKAFIYTEIDDMDVTYFIHYQVKVLTQAFEDLKEYVAKKKKEEQTISKYFKISGINERQAQILFWIEKDNNRFFTVKEIETVFSVNNQTARTDLENLVKQHLLKKVAVDKKSFNFWKGDDFDTIIS